MHTVDLGIWVHLLTCIASKYDNVLHKYGILPAADIAKVWDKLAKRAADMDGDDCMLKLNEYKIRYMHILLEAKKNSDKKSKTVEAWEHHLLMLVNVCCACAICVQVVCYVCAVLTFIYRLFLAF